jgi:diguanylate cyclase (GGDEF)-like protein
MNGFDDKQRLRATSVHAGVLLSVAVCAAMTAYATATWSQPHRGVMIALAAGAALATLVVALVPIQAIIDSRWCDAFFLGWSTVDLVFITTLCATDGASDTPLMTLFFLPLVYSALFYPMRMALATVAETLVLFVVVTVGIGSPDTARVSVYLAVLALRGALCVWAAREQERRGAVLAALSRTDALTGALNRRGFDERFAAELATAEREGTAPALVMLDLDSFKRVNDTQGHAAGDALLVWVVEQLLHGVRPADAVGRPGGDEFAVLLPRTACPEAMVIAERLREAIGERIATSFGLACAPEDGRDREALYRVADAALYRAKAALRTPT